MIADRLLDTAIDQFGRLGFEGASTRSIATASGTAMSSITYHFGSKEGLYLAAADRIVETVGNLQKPALEQISSRNIGTRTQAIEAFLDLLDSFAAMMLSEDSALFARFIIREQLDPTEAFDRIWTGMMSHVAGLFMELFARIRDDLPERERRATGMLLFGQAISMRAGRASFRRMLEVDDLGPAESELLRTRLRQNALAILEHRQ